MGVSQPESPTASQGGQGLAQLAADYISHLALPTDPYWLMPLHADDRALRHNTLSPAQRDSNLCRLVKEYIGHGGPLLGPHKGGFPDTMLCCQPREDYDQEPSLWISKGSALQLMHSPSPKGRHGPPWLTAEARTQRGEQTTLKAECSGWRSSHSSDSEGELLWPVHGHYQARRGMDFA